MPFQTVVNVNPALGVEGDFASSSPRAVVLAQSDALHAGPSGLTCGRFAWTDDGVNRLAYNTGTGIPDGFVGRHQEALIVTYLGETSMLIPGGFQCTLYSQGDFFVKNAGTNQVTPGMKAYANNADGTVTFAATGTPPSSFSMTASIAAGTGSSTASISDTILTTSGAMTGSFNPGGTISGTNVVSGTKIVRQLSGTAGGADGSTFLVSIPQTVASTTVSETHGVMTVTVATTGAVHVGDQLVAGGGGNSAVVAGTKVTALGTGTGGTGTYIVDNNTVVTSGTIAGTGATETKWSAASYGGPNEIIEMSSWQ